MRKAFRHTGVLMMMGVVALGLLGAAYTLWYEDLQITGNVSTGTLDADLSLHDLDTTTTNAATNVGLPVVGLPPAGWGTLTSGVATYLDDDGQGRDFWNGAVGYGNFTNDNFPEGKPQPTCEGSLISDPSLGSNDESTLNSLTLTMGGMYPYAGCEYEIDLHSEGSVPYHITFMSGQLQECTDASYTDCTNMDGNTAPWSTGLDPANPRLAECAGWFGVMFGKARGAGTFNGATGEGITQGYNGPGFPVRAWIGDTDFGDLVQIHPGDGNDLNCKFKVILDQNPNAEGKFYKYTATFRAHQWNEAIVP